ncbi:long-chain fatty acid--CoA ligase [Natronomonas gomsonensis]|uniref:AMP-dependent synthetase/ligase n=1 Tax=Natronomonas gomsonensis TaxID=1046043 RepID=UPI0020CA9512|nr:long-chain fatty acid--CoA ligase [Natronomonas gomsonensis]MCY4731430.1 long-chain fatty acid--CoA ligase [Natronomonas gomsonensis]
MDWRAVEREYTDEVIGETTIPELFFDSVARNGSRDAQMYKGGVYDRSLTGDVVPAPPAGEYGALTYEETGDIVRYLATGFRELGVGPDDRVGIYANTRMEWSQADYAIQSAEGVVTTVYTESSAPKVQYLLDDNDAMGCVVENEDLLETLLSVEDDLELEFVVVIDEVSERYADREDIHTLADVYELGADNHDEETFQSWLENREWTDLCSLVYTSGTTGDPKGVELTHKNWRTCFNQLRRRIGPRPDKDEDIPAMEAGMTALSFLPLAHAFERINHFHELGIGMTVAYAENPDTVGDDLQQVGPDAAASVPRVYERIYNQMREQASESPVKKRIFEWAVDTAQTYDDADDPGVVLETKLKIADKLVFSQVREALGGNVQLFVSGGGSLSEDLAKLYRAMGLTILEGYGLTETAPALTTNPPEDIRVGTMGIALCDVDLKLDPDVVSEETKASEKGEVGELLAKGPNVFEAYWNKPDKTEAAFTDDGYFRTGDIVSIDGDGYVRFVDRRKNLIVLDTGKNVAPEPIEDEFATSARVDQIMVVGDDRKFIGAVIAPNFEELWEWADEEDIDLPDDPAAAVADDRVHEWVAEEVDRVNEVLSSHETIKEFRLVPEEWTADNDLLTPSMKKKRRNIRAAYEEAIENIYGDDTEEQQAEAAPTDD